MALKKTPSRRSRAFHGGLIAVVSAQGQLHREPIARLAARHRLPIVYPHRFFVTSGGLISYGPDLVSQYRRKQEFFETFRGVDPLPREALR